MQPRGRGRRERLAAYRAAGVTRVSLGAQSTAPHVLAGLGRRHVRTMPRRAAAAVRRAGFETLEPRPHLRRRRRDRRRLGGTLADVLALPYPPPHISAYALTIEPGTPLARDADRHPDDDVLARRYELADEILSSAGYAWEEISNWALPGHSCRHNHLYWDQGDYLGIGSAAHSPSRRGTLVERPDPRALHRRHRRRTQSRGAAARCSPTSSGLRGALALALRTPTRGPVVGPPRARRSWTASSTTARGGPCSRSAAGCWPTRSPPVIRSGSLH